MTRHLLRASLAPLATVVLVCAGCGSSGSSGGSSTPAGSGTRTKPPQSSAHAAAAALPDFTVWALAESGVAKIPIAGAKFEDIRVTYNKAKHEQSSKTRGAVPEGTLPVGRPPDGGIAAAPGALYMITYQDLYRIDPVKGSARKIALGQRANTAVTVGAGKVFVSSDDDYRLLAVDQGTRKIAYNKVLDSGTSGSTPGLAYGAGSLWYATYSGLFRVRPASGGVAKRVKAATGERVATGPGAVYVTNRVQKTVTRIDPRTNAVTKRAKLPADARDVAVAGGFVWVASVDADAVFQLDPTTLKVIKTYDQPGPSHVTAIAGIVYTGGDSDTMGRIDPKAGKLDLFRIQVSTPYGFTVVPSS